MSEEINKAEETKVEEENLAAEETRMISDEARWYVVHTYSGYENKVKANIEKTVENRGMQDQIFEVSVPLQDVVEMKDGRKKTVQRKVFPGYVLLNMIMNDETWYVVRNTRGCTGFVGPASEPTPLSEKEVKSLFGIDVSSVEVNFKVGDKVQISGTAMDGFIGVVQNIDLEQRSVDLLVSMFGRETPTTLPISQVVAVEG